MPSCIPSWHREALKINSAVSAQPIPPGDDLVAANSELLAKATALHPYVPVMQELVGYDYDSAFPLLIRYLTPTGIRGFVVAALLREPSSVRWQPC